MTIEELKKIFEQNKNEEEAIKMKAYLKNQFEFLGIRKPKRAELEKEFIKSYKNKEKEEIIQVAKELHMQPYREYMYTSQLLLMANLSKLTIEDIYGLVDLTLINPWWENTDGFMMFVKRWLKKNPQYIEAFIGKYYQEDNFWLRRLALICQLSLKEATNFEALKKAILYNINDSEFFIQKAIGWSLRDYSKVNPKVVEEFINNNRKEMSNLAIKEGSKYL